MFLIGGKFSIPEELRPFEAPRLVMLLFLIPFLAILRDSAQKFVKKNSKIYLLMPFSESSESDIR